MVEEAGSGADVAGFGWGELGPAFGVDFIF